MRNFELGGEFSPTEAELELRHELRGALAPTEARSYSQDEASVLGEFLLGAIEKDNKAMRVSNFVTGNTVTVDEVIRPKNVDLEPEEPEEAEEEEVEDASEDIYREFFTEIFNQELVGV